LSDAAERDATEMRYLLGNLSEDEKTRIEEAFFADDSKFEALEVAEDELIDSYVRNQLSPEEQRQFKAKVQTSSRLLGRVNFARILAEKANSSLPKALKSSDQFVPLRALPAAKTKTRWWKRFFVQQPAWGLMTAACGLAFLVGVVLVSGWLHLRHESERLAAERAAYRQQKEELEKLSTEQRTRAEQLTTELQQAQNQRVQDRKSIEELQQALKLKETATGKSLLETFATVFLIPGSVRSGGAGQRELVVGPETKLARLQLALEKNDYATYNATIQTADGSVVFRKNGLKPHNMPSGPQLLLSLPSRRLNPNNNYIVQVDGLTATGQVESVNDYVFRVVK
jgi:hypothetical protein